MIIGFEHNLQVKPYAIVVAVKDGVSIGVVLRQITMVAISAESAIKQHKINRHDIRHNIRPMTRCSKQVIAHTNVHSVMDHAMDVHTMKDNISVYHVKTCLSQDGLIA